MALRLIIYALMGASLLTGSTARAQSSVVVFDLGFERDTLTISNPDVLATAAQGNAVYHPTDSLLFYLAADSGNTAIWSVRKDRVIRITSGKKYSALAVTPDQKGLSVLQNNDNKGVDLVKYSIGGSEGVVLASSVAFTRYAWVDDNSLVALFPGSPNQLKLLSIRPRKETPVAQNVSETVQRFYTTPSVTFIHNQSFNFSTVKRIGAEDGKINVVIDSEPEQSVFTWTPYEVLISTDGVALFSFDPKKDRDWKPVKVRGSLELSRISSMSVNASGNKIVVVTDITPGGER